jgi:hypothetical protein
MDRAFEDWVRAGCPEEPRDNVLPLRTGPQMSLPTTPRESRFYPASSLNGKPVASREWLVHGLVPQKTVTLFGGDGGTGKSLLALQLAVAVAAGTAWIGKPVSHGRVIFLSAEDDDDELHRRLNDILQAEGQHSARACKGPVGRRGGADRCARERWIGGWQCRLQSAGHEQADYVRQAQQVQMTRTGPDPLGRRSRTSESGAS